MCVLYSTCAETCSVPSLQRCLYIYARKSRVLRRSPSTANSYSDPLQRFSFIVGKISSHQPMCIAGDSQLSIWQHHRDIRHPWHQDHPRSPTDHPRTTHPPWPPWSQWWSGSALDEGGWSTTWAASTGGCGRCGGRKSAKPRVFAS